MADSATLVEETAAVARSMAGASIALVIVDDECRVAEASLAGCRLLGLARDEIVDRPLAEVFTPTAADRLVGVWDAFHETGGHAGPFELVGTRTGESIDISVTAAVVPGRHLVVLFPTGPTVPARSVGDPNYKLNGSRIPTSRERQILSMLATGGTDVKIAGKLDLSPATVQTHVRNAKAKLGARTRAQAVATALRHRIIREE